MDKKKEKKRAFSFPPISDKHTNKKANKPSFEKKDPKSATGFHNFLDGLLLIPERTEEEEKSFVTFAPTQNLTSRGAAMKKGARRKKREKENFEISLCDVRARARSLR